MSHTLERVQKLVTEECCNCGVLFAMPKDLQSKRLNDHGSFYCPNGHAQHYTGEPTETKLRRELREQQRQLELANSRAEGWEAAATAAQDQADAAQRSRAALRGVVTRQKHRAAAGMCPAGCRRHFQNLARHMHTQHPSYTEDVRDAD